MTYKTIYSVGCVTYIPFTSPPKNFRGIRPQECMPCNPLDKLMQLMVLWFGMPTTRVYHIWRPPWVFCHTIHSGQTHNQSTYTPTRTYVYMYVCLVHCSKWALNARIVSLAHLWKQHVINLQKVCLAWIWLVAMPARTLWLYLTSPQQSAPQGWHGQCQGFVSDGVDELASWAIAVIDEKCLDKWTCSCWIACQPQCCTFGTTQYTSWSLSKGYVITVSIFCLTLQAISDTVV